MSVLSDRWIKKMALEKEMIKPFISKQIRDKIYRMVYPHLVMTQEFLMNLKSLQMLILQ